MKEIKLKHAWAATRSLLKSEMPAGKYKSMLSDSVISHYSDDVININQIPSMLNILTAGLPGLLPLI